MIYDLPFKIETELKWAVYDYAAEWSCRRVAVMLPTPESAEAFLREVSQKFTWPETHRFDPAQTRYIQSLEIKYEIMNGCMLFVLQDNYQDTTSPTFYIEYGRDHFYTYDKDDGFAVEYRDMAICC